MQTDLTRWQIERLHIARNTAREVAQLTQEFASREPIEQWRAGILFASAKRADDAIFDLLNSLATYGQSDEARAYFDRERTRRAADQRAEEGRAA